MIEVEFFFDCSSPWTYLAFHNIQPLARDLDVDITWRPILVGAVFNTVNDSVYRAREAEGSPKQAYARKDLLDWARRAGLALRPRPTVFPVNSAKAMRGCLWADAQGKLVSHARSLFEAYWRDDRDISQPAILAAIAAADGFDPVAYINAVTGPALKAALKANTAELIARGGFGTPTIFVGKTDMYFGNDRLPLVRDAILARRSGVSV